MHARYLWIAFLAPWALGALAAPPAERAAALDRMGELNGVALACRFDDQMRRIKQALIDTLPKQRRLGARFQEKTNAAFMAFVQAGRTCPSPAGFAREVDRAVQRLEQAYAGAGS
ncbi:MAG: hypothetical protein D6721_05690 [Gammaproteobacteria bacterium]|nr:MAG: hypothetical protein D6721_05690 [Gammaproteobacteria bacterium]